MKQEKREQAEKLRKVDGLSINDISEKIGVAKSTVSIWVRNIALTKKQKEILKSNSGKGSGKRSKEDAEKRKQEALYTGLYRLNIKQDVEFAVICALYWGEGRKTQHEVSISNADSSLINLFVKWLIQEGLDFSATVQYHEENNVEYSDIQNWWIENTCLKIGNFNKPYVCKTSRASQRKNVGKLPFGTMNIRVKKSTNLFWNIMGGIEGLKI